MALSDHFLRSIMYEGNVLTLETYGRVEDTVFEKKPEKSSIEVRCITSSSLEDYQKDQIDQKESIGREDCRVLSKLVVLSLDCERLEAFVQSTKHDFRVFYLRQRNSYSRLQVLQDEVERLIRACAVFPKFKDFLTSFGARYRETEVGPPPMRVRFENRGFECAYMLRYIELTKRPGKYPWSLRHYTVYHKAVLDPDEWCSSWILVGASQRTERCIDDYADRADDIKTAHPFELHMLFLDTAISSWRPYLFDLSEDVKNISGRSKVTVVGKDQDHPDNFISVDEKDHQSLKKTEDETADVLLCLDSTMDTIAMFSATFKRLHTPKKGAVDHLSENAIVDALSERQRECVYIRKQAEYLLSKVQNTRVLISSLLERQTSHRLYSQMVALQNLEQAAMKENETMRGLAEKSSHDSTSVRILTVIMLIYLPCTAVSGFYSTDFVSNDQGADGAAKIQYSQNVWLFFAITLPLTLFTISAWWMWANFKVSKLQGFFQTFGKKIQDPEQSNNLQDQMLTLKEHMAGLPR